MPTIPAIQNQIVSGTHTYPIYIAFMSAADILAVAEVPAFSTATAHDAIASNVMNPPIREWQRPIELDRVAQISRTFDNTGELMPNPVLLAENVAGNCPAPFVQARMVAGFQTGMVDLQLTPPNAGQAKPLWVLDGQHRINGLSGSLQATNMVPVVILLNHGGNHYSGPLLAKLFAQVTTTANKLDDLHNEWLTFAFKLGKYSALLPSGTAQSQAMETVTFLCRTPQISGRLNPFFNRIKFNSRLQLQPPAPGGFAYSCIELQSLLFDAYFNAAITGVGVARLSPGQLAEQLVLAHTALSGAVQNPTDSVFFGSSHGSGQQIMQDAFVAAVCAGLRRNSPPGSWTAELNTLQFGSTNWKFNWVRSLNGTAASVSRKLAFKVLSECFEARALPAGAGSIADILKGNQAAVSLTFSSQTAKGRVSKKGQTSIQVSRGSSISHAIHPHKHLRVAQASINIGKLTVTDKNSPPGRLVTYSDVASSQGMALDSNRHNNPLSLLITMEHYGNTSSTAEVDLSW
jgi:hypothetical protein